MSTPDLSKVIEAIMQNPSLISEIQGLVKSEEAPTAPAAASVPPPVIEAPAEEKKEAIAQNVSTAAEISPKLRRAQLLSAMKSYVSPERAKAIDSMLSISEILEVMKVR